MSWLRSKDEILEYPYSGVVMSVVQGVGRNPDTETKLYEGPMDEHMVTSEEGSVLQTSRYILSIPLTYDALGAPIIPKKGDKVSLVRFGETIGYVVDNSEPSQLGGVSIYATRNTW